jgi:outer membrane cobalamin receptor
MNMLQNTTELSVEAYYKNVDQLIEYKEGAKLLMVEDIETQLLRGVSRNYGVEFMLNKKYGRLNGRIGYTLSKC